MPKPDEKVRAVLEPSAKAAQEAGLVFVGIAIQPDSTGWGQPESVFIAPSKRAAVALLRHVADELEKDVAQPNEGPGDGLSDAGAPSESSRPRPKS